MRKEPFSVGSFVHVYNRGNREELIFRNAKDKWRFLQMLFYFNNRFSPSNIFRELEKLFRSDLAAAGYNAARRAQRSNRYLINSQISANYEANFSR